MTENEPRAEYDSPWKDAITLYFESFLAFFFPNIRDAIDWNQGYEFLDKEFQKIVREGEIGRKTTDKLVKAILKNGEETWFLIHIEVQSQAESEFTERMYIYNCRIYDRYRRPVVSLAVLADETKSWRPREYNYEMLGCQVLLRFLSVKLLDYTAKTLAESKNPFAVIVAAHRETQKSRNDPNHRYREKLRIAKNLYQRGYERQDILELFRLIDWMMTLPASMAENFSTEIRRYEEENQMPYITSVERLAIEKGREEGLLQKSREAIFEILKVRFEDIPEELVETINQIQAESTLTTLLRQSITLNSLEVFQEIVTSTIAESDKNDPH